ncbi:ABC transporter permease [Dyadobacter sp. CY261]|uniref:ABC transporter permease n=1 Tax=Dyadobacter sp. CY261 TaxID=2907203 RepID=UPI001F2D61BB|nr:ABC transporter permease [Dyadobacter sp. CY261]MCF0073345.1 ABC transporter permease [Dyadobacter sp. CY261]
MISSYLKIAFRSLWNKKVFASINIFGLAIGLATCMLILLFVQHELSYDRYNVNADRIFRVTMHGRIGGNEIGIAGASAPVGPALMRDYPGMEAYTRLDGNGTYLVKNGEKRFTEDRVVFVDSNFFDFFSIPLLKGNSKTMLTEPKTIVITESTALKYFGREDPIGKSLTMGDQGLFRVTGVCQDVPSNSHFHFDFFGSIKSTEVGKKWLSSGAHTYVLLRKGYPVEKLTMQIPQLVKKYIGPEIQEFLGMTYDEYLRKGDSFGFRFQPLTDIHLQSNLENELEANGNVKYIYIFTAIAAFILLIACINFMNLSTAGSAGRAKEVGVRKVMGSVRQQLMAQFLIESILLTILALVVAFGLVVLLLPGFNDLAGKQFGLKSILSARMVAYAFAGCLMVGLLAGSYPAFFLSAFKPVAVLKGSIQAGIKSGWLRNTLVTIQFVVSIGMIIGTMVVYQQLHFIQNKKVGFDKDQVLILHDTHLLGDKAKAFKDQLIALSAVSSVTLAGYMPAGVSNASTDGFLPENADNKITPYRFTTYQVDEDYLSTLGIGLTAGRNFSKNFGADSGSVLINEAAAKQFGWKNPIGKRVQTVGNGSPESKRFYTVVGVTKNFHFRSMHERIAPLVMFYGGDLFQIAVRIKTNDIPGLLKVLEKTWKANSDNPFTYSFLDERFNKMYESEMRIGKLFGIFASLAVVIACLGLFGLAAFTTIRRTKEIGVRKVLGASVLSIVSLLSKDFVKLVAIAILIASPLAWYGMDQWLSDFAYKVNIEWWVFVLAGAMAVGIALLTVSFQSIKAALVNPVKSLRSE